MITREQAIEFGSSWGRTELYHSTLRNSDGSAVRARVNGKCKVWKTRPTEFQLPMKHGLRDCFYLTQRNASEWLTIDPTEEPRRKAFIAKRLPGVAARAGLTPDAPLPILHDALVDKGEDSLAQLVAIWIKQEAECKV